MMKTFVDVPGTDTDNKAYLMESRSLVLLRLAPVFLILASLIVGVLSVWIEPNGDRIVRLAELVVSGCLGSLIPGGDVRVKPVVKESSRGIQTWMK